jgi:general secretion pathway protein D
VETPTVALKLAGPTQVKRNEPFELQVLLGSNVPLRGLPMELQFPSDKLELLEVKEGGFFQQGGGVTSFSKGAVDAQGQLAIGVLRNTATGATGEGPMLTLRFRALAPGGAQVRVTKAQPIGLGAPVTAPVLPAPFELQVQ